MRRRSVKVRLTIWYTALMVLMAALVLAFVAMISSSVASQSSRTYLSQVVRGNLDQVSLVDGSLQLGEEFTFLQDGVYTVVYSQSGALLAGQLPQPFSTVSEPFVNGLTRPVDTDQGEYYVLDFWVPSGWESGVWVRGLMEVSEGNRTLYSLLLAAAIAMPGFILLAALGGYWLVRRAFRPLDAINATASAINEGRDLSARIGAMPGHGEFTQLAGNFDRMLERLERAFEAEKQFTADASHELRTPVTVILSACEYAEKYDETPEERQETLQTIHRQGRKMADLISQLLQMTRMDQGTEAAQLERTDLTDLVRGLCEEQGELGRRLIPDLQEGVTAQANRPLLSRLLQNLIDNAEKYGAPGGRIWVTLRRETGEIRLTVRDEGPGIPPDQQEKIWQRFYQVDPSRGGDRGAGLGLSIVQQIARVHGGTMTLESVPGRGSAFTLHLPEGGASLPGKNI